jgi:hypothetical protein
VDAVDWSYCRRVVVDIAFVVDVGVADHDVVVLMVVVVDV